MDFLQLLFASLQLFVFKIEKNVEYREAYGGGDNDCDIDKMDRMVPGQQNDFIAKKTYAFAFAHFWQTTSLYESLIYFDTMPC